MDNIIFGAQKFMFIAKIFITQSMSIQSNKTATAYCYFLSDCAGTSWIVGQV